MKNWIARTSTEAPARIRITLWIAFTSSIALASLTKTTAMPLVSFLAAYADKCAHFGMYLVYALICIWARQPSARPATTALAIASYCTAYGFTMEVLQASLPALQRQFAIDDALANGLGAATGAWLWARTATPSPSSPHVGAAPSHSHQRNLKGNRI